MERIVSAGIEFASISDHECIGSYLSVVDSLPQNVKLYPAAEFSTYYNNHEIHILVYFTKGITAEIKQFLSKLQEDRLTRAKATTANLRKSGVKISCDDIKHLATGECITRAHIARALIATGVVPNSYEAFSRYLSYGKGIVPTPFLTPKKVLDFASQNNGVAVWAHPEMESFDLFLKEFIDAGLRGVEICSKKRQEIYVLYFERTALSFNLVLTYGSDWHGFQSEPLTAIEAPKAHVEKFLSLFD
ncbi:MAG: hypothetical protein ABIH42_09995 [Planctomycetota bacterium]